MVYMTKPKEAENKDNVPEIDCRTCLHYPKPNTTGKSEDLLTRTINWTVSFCGQYECEGKVYTPINEQKDSVVKGDTDEQEQKKTDTNDIESKE